jgi:hypothetical protein
VGGVRSTPTLRSANFASCLTGKCKGYRLLFIPILVVWILGAFVGVLAPETVLTDNVMLQNYVSAISIVTDPKHLIGTKSSFPEVSTLYHSVVYWGFPFSLLLWWCWMNEQLQNNKTDMIFKPTLSFGNRLTILLLLPLWLFLTYVSFNLNHGGDTRIIAFGTSRIQLALFGMVFQFGMTGMLVLSIFSVKRLLTVNKTKGGK